MPSDERGPSSESLERRVASLESTVRALTQQLEELRGQRIRDHAPNATPHPPSPSAFSVVPASIRALDIEALVGRYGTLVLATITALAAVGTFLGWAIANGWLGPAQRIALGLIVAAGLAVGGLRLRPRERSFGASLLALALAITHVCAWGAGPALHLVPEWVAFALAALVSIALAVFAHRENDEPLWSVGFSGAAIAPFVTSSSRGNLMLLAAYGVAVLATAGYAMGVRPWIVAGRLFLLGAALYTAALATGFEKDYGPLIAMWFPLLVATLAVIPWVDGLPRRERLRAMGVLSAMAAVRSGLGMNTPLEKRTVAGLIAAAGLVWLVIVDRTHGKPEPSGTAKRRLYEGDWLDAGILPIGFAVASLMALDASARENGILMAVAAGVLLVTVMRLPQGSLRDAAVFATVLCALISALLLARDRPLSLIGTVAVLSAGCFAANIVWRSVSWTMFGALGLAWSAVASLAQLIARPSYGYTPFGTEPSAVAAMVLVCALASWRLAQREEPLGRLVGSGALAWAFVWVHQEIAFAVNQTIATLLRVSYYAATSVAAVWVGRGRGIALLRHIGLGLAILAAGTALYGARKLGIAARIGSDLVAAVFLLAIAYWYRKPGSQNP